MWDCKLPWKQLHLEGSERGQFISSGNGGGGNSSVVSSTGSMDSFEICASSKRSFSLAGTVIHWLAHSYSQNHGVFILPRLLIPLYFDWLVQETGKTFLEILEELSGRGFVLGDYGKGNEKEGSIKPVVQMRSSPTKILRLHLVGQQHCQGGHIRCGDRPK